MSKAPRRRSHQQKDRLVQFRIAPSLLRKIEEAAAPTDEQVGPFCRRIVLEHIRHSGEPRKE